MSDIREALLRLNGAIDKLEETSSRPRQNEDPDREMNKAAIIKKIDSAIATVESMMEEA